MRNYNSKNFFVTASQLDDCVFLTQTVHNPIVGTRELPYTYRVLEKTIPSIFKNHCDNYKKYPFVKEVKDTEVGHLYEHLILEYLKLIGVKKFGKADFSGETSWDWAREKKGTFRIIIYSNKSQNNLFNHAFKKATLVLEKIYNGQRAGSVPRPPAI